MNVVEMANELAVIYHCDLKKVRLAALLHDCAKSMSADQLLSYAKEYRIKVDKVSRHDPQLLHGAVGAVLAEEKYGINDYDIKNAIRYHTTGGKKMSNLDKIIYLADYIEKDRYFPGIEEIRDVAAKNLNQAVIMALTTSICYIAKSGLLIHKRTIDARNELIINERKIRNIL
jgi:predicted HD superfamily hydrolase involved in NAD metabolism